MRRTIVLTSVVATLVLGAAWAPIPANADNASRRTPASLRPPRNPYLADSVWPTTHHDNYQQESSASPGPTNDEVTAERTIMPGVPVNSVFSPKYEDGTTVAWTTTSNTPDRRGVVKFDIDTGEIIDTFIPVEEGLAPPETTALLSGNYKILDRENRLIVGYSTRLEVYGDAFPKRPGSPIELLGTYDLPAKAFCRADDSMVGLIMTYDGSIAFATDQGMVGVLPRELSKMRDDRVRVTSLNGDRCQDTTVPTEDLERVTNNIAADESGGIYVVSNTKMLRFAAKGSGPEVDIDWSAPYETGTALSAVRIGGKGSGSTPTLMGQSKLEDSFVVITDGQDLMHLVLFWRGKIPKDWEPIAPGKSRRIACEIPVRFGDPEATNTETEQSVLVNGYSSYLTNNRLEDTEELSSLPEATQRGSAALLGGDPALAPRGAERLDWDPKTRTCASVWANTEVAIPNGVPTLSDPSRMVYGIGLGGEGVWGLIGLDSETGEQRFFAPGAGGADCAEPQLSQFVEGAAAVFRPYFERIPTSCDNSFYGSAIVGPDRTIYTSNFGALTRYVPNG